MGLYDFTFASLIERNAICYHDRTAWVEADDGRQLTFAEFGHRVQALAAGLSTAGLAKGDRLAIVGKNCLEYFLLYGAAAFLGAIVVPINWRISAAEALFNLRDTQPKMVFADPEFAELVDGLKEQLVSLERIYNLTAGDGPYDRFETLWDDAAAITATDVCDRDGFVILHTAAVAGRPRGALLSHGNFMAANLQRQDCLPLAVGDVHLNLLPLFHVGGLLMATGCFHRGLPSVNVRKFDPRQAVTLIEEHKVSVLFDFTPILGSILDAQAENGGRIETLQKVLGLESPDTIERYQTTTGGTFFSLYGQTETSGLATMGSYDQRPGAAGRPLSLTTLGILDDAGCPVPPGTVGEICVRGPGVFQGYWQLPEETAEAFREGWHHTGDLGRLDPDGFLWYAGRKPEKELIKPGGENVYPAEVERTLVEHPAVSQAVVFGIPHPRWKEGIKAVCRLEAGCNADAQELIRFVGSRIAGFKKPHVVEFVADLPQLEDGTPDREKVKQIYRE